MTLHDLLSFNADAFDKLSPAELHQLCEPFFNVTRPDKAVAMVTGPTKKAPKMMTEKEQKIARANEILKKFDINL